MAEVHGEVVSVDRAHQLVVVHHRAHSGMGMEMMMAVKLRDARQLAGVRKGQQIRLRCDPSANPYVCVKLP
jgi:Cu/Ag efflux protein CusF